jgi:peptide/nickel transport system ATP-binding protein
MTPPLLQVRGYTVEMLSGNGARTLVQSLDFDVAPGQTLAIIGESGSGKSVATTALVGLAPSALIRVTAGSALFEGRELIGLPEQELRRLRGHRIGMVFQEPMSALNPMLPIGDQIAETLVAHRGTTWRTARAEAVRLLEQVRIPDAARRASQYPSALSGGMRQRVVIAAAIACKPSLLIADEPTTALDATVQIEILQLLTDLKAEVGCAIVLITHDMAVVRQAADTVAVMQRGRIVEQATRDALLAEPKAEYTRMLIAASLPRSDVPEPKDAAPDGTPALSIDNLTVSFARPRRSNPFQRPQRLFAVDGVSLSIDRGETLALVGESGSGKTTLARAVLGLITPDAGQVRVAGRPVGRQGQVQFIFQDPQASLDPRYRAWESVMEPLKIRGDTSALRHRAAALFEQVGLDTRLLDRYTHELSGGQRQRLGIARALCGQPDLVIADEAVAALDASTKLQILELFLSLQASTQLPLLFITHDFAVVSRLAHRVAVMRFGRLLEIGPTAVVLRNPRHAYTRALIAAASGVRASSPASFGHRTGAPGSRPAGGGFIEVGTRHFVQLDEQPSFVR